MEKNLVKLRDCIQLVRHTVASDWQMQQFQIYLEVGIRHPEGITQTEIAEKLQLAQGVISRNCLTMARRIEVKDGKKEIVGHDLVYMQPDLEYTRRLCVRLTPKGEHLFKKLNAILNGFEKEDLIGMLCDKE